jgi:hypothetical protein
MRVLREAARQMFGQHTVIELKRAGELHVASAGTSQAEPAPQLSEPEPQAANAPESTGLPEVAIESTPMNGAGDRIATFDDAIRLFGSGEAGSNNEER